MSYPFPLSSGDYSQFMDDVGYTNLYGMPSWGGVVQWRGRYVLVFSKQDGTYVLTDITGGIPDTSAPGGMIPASVVVDNVPRVEYSAAGVFFYSLPSNFAEVAREKMTALAQGAADITKPLLPDLTLLAIIGVAALIFIYAPRPRS